MKIIRYFLDTEFRERPGSIELISIGIVAEDGREFYAENAFFNWHDVAPDDWLQVNVRPHLTGPPARKVPSVIAERVKQFAPPAEKPEFWGYFADYDWVVFCWLFGRMIDLPDGYPLWCRDIKQEMAAYGIKKDDVAPLVVPGGSPGAPHNALADAHWHRHLFNEVRRLSEGIRRGQLLRLRNQTA